MITSNRRRSFLICALLSALTLLAYWPVLNNGFIDADDYTYIIKNPHVQGGLTFENVKWSFQAGYAGNWHPLTWMSHMLDVQLFGLDPRWHHLVNLLFHLANTLLLFLLFQGLTRMTWRSALVAALFAVHPLHVESVAWAAERKDVLSTFFFLLTLICYARYAQGRSRVKSRESGAGSLTLNLQHSTLNYSLALLFFALGLMSKPMLVTVPFVLLLLDYWPLGRISEFGVRSSELKKSIRPSTLNPQLPGATTCRDEAKRRRERSEGGSTLLLEKLPFLVLSAGSSWMTYVAQARKHAVSAVADLPLYARGANAVVSYLKYLGQTFWPAKLAFFYPYRRQADFWEDWQILGAVVILAAVSLLAFVRLKRIPWLATGWFWFLGTLVPVIGIVQVGGQSMADRYTYIPLIGVFLCLVWAGAEISVARHFNRIIPAAIGAAAVIACAVATRQQVKYWRDTFTIASHALAVTGNNAVAHDLLGQALADQGKYEPAVEQFRAALATNPDFPMVQYNLALTLTRLGDARAAAGKLEEAVAAYQSAVKVRPLPQTLSNLGSALDQLGRHEEAIEQYRQALQLQPDSLAVHFNLASALAADGKMAEADAQFADALRLSPDPLRTLIGFGRLLAGQGRLAEAVAKFREAVRRYPANAGANLELGVNLRLAGQTNEAARFFAAAGQLEPDLAEKNLRAGRTFEENGRIDAALQCLTVVAWLKPDDADAHEDLGLFCLRHGRPGDALEQFQETLRLRPDAQSHGDLGSALTRLGRAPEAAGQYEIAVKLNPDSPEALNNLAWLLATAPDAQVRNGPRAVALAEQACRLTDYQQPSLLGTLAAAYAEAGRFAEAVQTAGKAIALDEVENHPDLAKRNQELLELYRAGKTAAQSPSRPDQ